MKEENKIYELLNINVLKILLKIVILNVTNYLKKICFLNYKDYKYFQLMKIEKLTEITD